MRLVLQRADRASVEVDGQTVGAIGPGLVVFVGAGKEDVTGPEAAAAAAGAEGGVTALARKVATLRIFADAEGKTNLSLLDTGGAALVISQFTLYADCRRGRRPSFTEAADPEPAEALVEKFREALDNLGVPTAAGRFGAHMTVSVVNDGPFTVILEGV
jgi:D-tyrosyl-tRNA(Tyr) deacylase